MDRRLTTTIFALMFTTAATTSCSFSSLPRRIERANSGTAFTTTSGAVTAVVHFEHVEGGKVVWRVRSFVDGMQIGESAPTKARTSRFSQTIELTAPCSLMGQRRVEVVVERRWAGSADYGSSFSWQRIQTAMTQVRIVAAKETVLVLRMSEGRLTHLSSTHRQLSGIIDTNGVGAPRWSGDVSGGPSRPGKLSSVDRPLARSGKRRRGWALIVGVSTYRGGLPRVTTAENDARAFQVYADKVMGIPEANTKLLLNEWATRSDLSAALREWLPRNVGPKDTVVFYFSGHGAPDLQNGQGYLVPFDGRPSYLSSTAYSMADVSRDLSRLRAKNTLAFVDACFSGVGDRSVIAAGARPIVRGIPLREQVGSSLEGRRLTLAAAAESSQVALSTQDGNHGLFTYHLLGGLRGAADRNRDGRITVGELMEHVGPRVRGDAQRQNQVQRPSVVYGSAGADAELAVFR